MRLTDLREILRYVPQYRDKTFVIALDGALVEEENFRNLLLDITLLRSLRIAFSLAAAQSRATISARVPFDFSHSARVSWPPPQPRSIQRSKGWGSSQAVVSARRRR